MLLPPVPAPRAGALLSRFSGVRALVVGDAMLDRFIVGTVTRIGNDLAYTRLWRYVQGNQAVGARSPVLQRASRTTSDLIPALGRLLYHELTHANDFLPPRSHLLLNPGLRVYEAVPAGDGALGGITRLPDVCVARWLGDASEDARRWFAGLWQGKRLAVTVGWISVFASLVLFLLARFLPSEASPDAGGKDLFAHFSEIRTSGFKTLAENQRVSFEVTQGAKGPQASNIQPE